MNSPRKIVEIWVDAFNDGDSAALGRLFAEDAVNHQVMWDPITSICRQCDEI